MFDLSVSNKDKSDNSHTVTSVEKRRVSPLKVTKKKKDSLLTPKEEASAPMLSPHVDVVSEVQVHITPAYSRE